MHDSLIADTAIEASITGTLWGGALYLDNFRFDGMKSFDNCIITSTDEILNENDFSFVVENNKLTVFLKTGDLNSEIEVFNMNGQKLVAAKINAEKSDYDLSSLPESIYFLSIVSEKTRETKKFVLVR